jgi:redox-sensitive bicupin YhaK (pirin superfamily)
VNLPAKDKLVEPRDQEYAPDRIPVATPSAGVSVKVIAGDVDGVHGPIVQPATDPLYLDIGLDAGRDWQTTLPEGHNAFAYVFEGTATIGEGEDARALETHELAVLGGGDLFKVRAGDAGARLILVAGRPLGEPVARYGPFVMNTKEQIMQAFVDFQEGRF